MFEKVNPSHPDKIADRIAGAIVDLAYKEEAAPRIAVEVLIGHGSCHIITESSVKLERQKVADAVTRIAGNVEVDFTEAKQDCHLSSNQENGFRAGDNGIFRGVPVTDEQRKLSGLAREIYKEFPTDGKYILDGNRLVICQSCAKEDELKKALYTCYELTVNPLGEWTGGIEVDTGAVNRKLGSDMGDGVTGGGLHGKDLSKADVSVNIYAHLKAAELGEPVEISCAIGDEYVDGRKYSEIVEIAREYIRKAGGFEKFAEWGLI